MQQTPNPLEIRFSAFVHDVYLHFRLTAIFTLAVFGLTVWMFRPKLSSDQDGNLLVQPSLPGNMQLGWG